MVVCVVEVGSRVELCRGMGDGEADDVDEGIGCKELVRGSNVLNWYGALRKPWEIIDRVLHVV